MITYAASSQMFGEDCLTNYYLPDEQAVKFGYRGEAATHVGWVQSWMQQQMLLSLLFAFRIWDPTA
jgi:hypothetical protein